MGEQIVLGCFFPFAQRDKTIRMDDEPICQAFSKQSKECNVIDISIYAADTKNPATVHADGVEKVGKVRVDFGEEKNDTKLIVEFVYSDTTLRVFAYPDTGKGRNARKA